MRALSLFALLLAPQAFAQDAEEAESPETETPTEPEAEPEAKPKAEPEAKPKAEPEAEPKAEPEAEPKAEAEAEAEPEVEPEPEPEPVAAPMKASGRPFEAPVPTAASQAAPVPLELEVPMDERRIEVAAELGATAYRDEHYDVFSSDDSLPVRGLRVGYRVLDRVVAQAAWSHGARGATVWTGGDDDYDWVDDTSSLNTAYYADAFALGAKVDLPLLDRVFYPFVAGRGQLALQRIRLDDDPSDADSPGQQQQTALAPGYELTAGFELRTPLSRDVPVQAAWTLELGRAALAEASFGDLGTLQSGGFLARTGIGLRF